MHWEEWRFSAKLAWQDPVFRSLIITSTVLYLGTTTFLLWRLLPEGWRTGVLTVHYNVYLGIDDVRPWMFILFFPAIALVVLGIDISVALGLFRRDVLASKTLLSAGLAAILIWMINIFFLIRVNG